MNNKIKNILNSKEFYEYKENQSLVDIYKSELETL